MSTCNSGAHPLNPHSSFEAGIFTRFNTSATKTGQWSEPTNASRVLHVPSSWEKLQYARFVQESSFYKGLFSETIKYEGELDFSPGCTRSTTLRVKRPSENPENAHCLDPWINWLRSSCCEENVFRPITIDRLAPLWQAQFLEPECLRYSNSSRNLFC